MSEFDRDLNPLLRCISSSPDGAKDLEALYKRHGIDPSKGPDELARVIRLDGGNTIANLFRGRTGVPYKKVVKDVAKKLGVKVSNDSSLKETEVEILGFIAKEYWSELSEEDKEDVIEQVKKIKPGIKIDIKDAILDMGAPIFLRAIGPLFSTMIAKAAGFAFGSRFALSLVPGLNVILGITFGIYILGPAYRKTVHTVVELAYRRLYNSDS